MTNNPWPRCPHILSYVNSIRFLPIPTVTTMVRIGSFCSIFVSWAIVSSNNLVAADVTLVNVPRGRHAYTRTCIRALSQSVRCDKSLLRVDASNNYYNEDTISALCTASCKESLDMYLNQVKAACGTSRYIGADGLSYHSGYGAQQALEHFDYACMNNSWVDIYVALRRFSPRRSWTC